MRNRATSGKRMPQPRIRATRPPTDRSWIRPYDRTTDLPRLLPLLAADLQTPTREAHARLVALLRRALRAERIRASRRHWTYNPARHAALVRALRHEVAALHRKPLATVASRREPTSPA